LIRTARMTGEMRVAVIVSGHGMCIRGWIVLFGHYTISVGKTNSRKKTVRQFSLDGMKKAE